MPASPLEDKSPPTELEARHFCCAEMAGWLATELPGVTCFYSPNTGLQASTATPDFYMSAWDLNSSPYNRKQFYLLGYLLSSNTLYFPHGSTEPSTGPGPHAVQQVFFRQTISQPFFPLGMDLNTWLLPSQELEPSSL